MSDFVSNVLRFEAVTEILVGLQISCDVKKTSFETKPRSDSTGSHFGRFKRPSKRSRVRIQQGAILDDLICLKRPSLRSCARFLVGLQEAVPDFKRPSKRSRVRIQQGAILDDLNVLRNEAAFGFNREPFWTI